MLYFFIFAGAQKIIDELVTQSLLKKKEEELQSLSKEANRLVALNDNNNNLSELIPSKKRLRNKYPEEFKRKTVRLFDQFDSAHKLCNFLNNYNPLTCDKLTPKTILRWKKKFDDEKMSGGNISKKKRMGRPYCEEFDKEVFDECIFYQVRVANGEEELVVTANVAYSYEVIRQCANNVLNRAYAHATTSKNGKQLTWFRL